MERITREQLNERARNVNRRLDGRWVFVQQRNGSTALDEYQGRTCVRTLTVGTKREVAEFLHAMMVGIDLSRES